MSSPVVTVRPGTPVKAAIGLVTSHGFTALPVVDVDDRHVATVLALSVPGAQAVTVTSRLDEKV